MKCAFVIKNVRRPTAVKLKVVEKKEGRIVVLSKFKLDVTKFGIPRPQFMVVKMDPVIQVTMKLVIQPKRE